MCASCEEHASNGAGHRGVARRHAAVARQGTPEGPLAREVVVFTGALPLPQRRPADIAAEVGRVVPDGVNKLTTRLVVGDQDLRRIAGQEKSAKHRQAEELSAAGRRIRALQESDFLGLRRL